jgi:hypothetical protein
LPQPLTRHVETPFDGANWCLSVLTDGFEGLAILTSFPA